MRSVVLASYQGQDFIGEQIDSILAQLSPDDELVVSDDASTDRTLEVVAERRDPRIRTLTNRVRAGYIENFQRAIEQARGDHVFFSDQDDVWLPNKVTLMDSALRVNACVASDAIVVNNRLETLHPSYFKYRGARSFSPSSIFLKPPIIGATLACRRRYLDTLLPLPSGIPHDFWLSVNASWDDELGIVDRPLILYRRHTSAASPSATDRKRALNIIATERWKVVQTVLQRRCFSARR
jgi:glycosyltransferase involved in cell wall biosynthesis